MCKGILRIDPFKSDYTFKKILIFFSLIIKSEKVRAIKNLEILIRVLNPKNFQKFDLDLGLSKGWGVFKKMDLRPPELL